MVFDQEGESPVSSSSPFRRLFPGDILAAEGLFYLVLYVNERESTQYFHCCTLLQSGSSALLTDIPVGKNEKNSAYKKIEY